ncbi:MAG: hypothetical protein IPQ10_12925 [Saprospiraceae bacterium]|nr:hypothetical protein [Saprospiraceae bacterium]MBL0261937.1 hypothetical protein [Saprospiraceae bacterium]
MTRKEDKPKPKVYSEKTIYVRALGESKILNNAKIIIGDHEFLGDQWGMHTVKEKFDKERLAFKITCPGYFNSYYAEKPYESGHQIHSLVMRPKHTIRLSASSNARFLTNANSEVYIHPNSFLSSNGQKYSLNFYVEYFDFDLTKHFSSESFPSDYMTIDSNETESTLHIHQLLNINFLDINQTSLKCNIPIEVNTSLYGIDENIPLDSISVFKYNEKSNYWEFYNNAIIENNKAACRIMHSGTYSCASLHPKTNISGSIDQINDSFLPTGKIFIYSNNNSLIKTIDWNDKGEWATTLASDMTYHLKIKDCNQSTIYTQEIQTNHLKNNILKINLNGTKWYFISGKVIDCYNSAVPEAYVMDISNDLLFYALSDSSGKFGIAYIPCSSLELKLLKCLDGNTESSLESFRINESLYSRQAFQCQSGSVYLEFSNRAVKKIDNCVITLEYNGLSKTLQFVSTDKSTGSIYQMSYSYKNNFFDEKIQFTTLVRGTKFFQLQKYGAVTAPTNLISGKRIELKIADCSISDENGNLSDQVSFAFSGMLQ